MKLPANLTIEQVMEACESNATSLSNIGFCLACGEEADGCEPDARNYVCEACGANRVFGAEEIILQVGLL